MNGLFAPGVSGDVTELLSATCTCCQRISFPRTNNCVACGGSTVLSTLVGPAVLTVLTAVLAQPPGAKIQAPYEVGVAEFDEGICVIGLIDGTVERGDLVEPVLVTPFPGGQAFAFRRAGAGAGRKKGTSAA